jgi:hypothetical protein
MSAELRAKHSIGLKIPERFHDASVYRKAKLITEEHEIAMPDPMNQMKAIDRTWSCFKRSRQ